MKFLSLKTNPALLKTFVIYLAVSLILMIAPARCTAPVRGVVLYPFTLLQQVVLRAVRGVGGAGRKVSGLWRADREAVRLRERVSELEARLAEETARRKSAEARLAQLAPIPAEIQSRVVPATVVGFDPAPLRRVALLNRGSRSGIVVNSPVLWRGHVVGRVESADPLRSRAVLLGDPECRVAVRCARSRARGILEGIGAGMCIVKYVDLLADVKPGDRFVSSGLDGIFPAGHPVGECTRASTESGEIFMRVDLRPALDITRLDEVAVLLPCERVANE